jgi:hypothetical protein
MKKVFTLFAFASFYATHAQPVISSGSTLAPVGFADSITQVISSTSPGMGGAAVNWDFSILTPSTAGYIAIVNPATSPYYSTFPTATYATVMAQVGDSPFYEYDVVSAGKLEMIASRYTGSAGSNYSTNPKTIMPFPFHYTDSVTDNYQKTTNSGPSAVTLTYDGYGTLTTPYGVYSNVVRIKEDYGSGDFYYEWYTTSPYLVQMARYDNSVSAFQFLKSIPTGISITSATLDIDATISPMPVTSTAIVRLSGNISNAQMTVMNMLGEVVTKLSLNVPVTTFDRGNLASGMYFFTICSNNQQMARGKILIQ